MFGERSKTSQHRCNNCFLVRCKALFGFSPHLAFLRLPLRAGAEVSSRGVMLARGLGHISFSPRLQRSAKALSTHTHHGGLLLRSGGRLRREVIVGSDSGGRCQASFRIRSLRSSCCIFYWRNKRTARYFHTRAISLRAAAKETRWGQESVEGKQNSSFRNPKRLNTQPSAAAFPCHGFWGQNLPQMDQQQNRRQTPPPDKSVSNIHFHVWRKPSSA